MGALEAFARAFADGRDDVRMVLRIQNARGQAAAAGSPEAELRAACIGRCPRAARGRRAHARRRAVARGLVRCICLVASRRGPGLGAARGDGARQACDRHRVVRESRLHDGRRLAARARARGARERDLDRGLSQRPDGRGADLGRTGSGRRRAAPACARRTIRRCARGWVRARRRRRCARPRRAAPAARSNACASCPSGARAASSLRLRASRRVRVCGGSGS